MPCDVLCYYVLKNTDVFIKAAFLKRCCKFISSYLQTHKRHILFPLYFPMSPSLLSTFEQDRFLTGSWWGVRRVASSHNLSPGADRLVTRKCIQWVLSLHLPYFEVALPTLQLVVRDCVFISTTTPNSHWKEAHVSPCNVCSFQCVCVCVCERESTRECQCIASENSRSFFYVLPTDIQPVPPIKVVLNSAVIPIPALHFHLTFSGFFKRLPVSSLWSAPVCPTCLARPFPPCQAL